MVDRLLGILSAGATLFRLADWKDHLMQAIPKLEHAH